MIQTDFSNFYRLILLLIVVTIVPACKNNNKTVTTQPPVNPTSVSYGGNYRTVQNLTEDFESIKKASYNSGKVSLKTGSWYFADALLSGSSADYKFGKQTVRLRSNGKISMLFDVEGSVSVTVKHAAYGQDDASSWALFSSTEGGKTYHQVGKTVVSVAHQLKGATFNVNKTGLIRFEIRKLSGGKNRINIDDFTISGTQDIKNNATTSVSTGDTIALINTNKTNSAKSDSTIAGDNDNLLCGNPSNATANISNYNNYLINQKYYTISYSRDRCGPNWVCWHLGNIDLGSTDRLNDFRADTKLPAGWYEAQNYSYKNTGFDKGHNCPSGDRTNTQDANSATFLMDNIVPQAPYNNQRTWEHLESFCRSQVQAGNEVYIMMGSYGTGGTGSKGYATTIDQGRINVPARIWKVVVVIPNGNNDLKRITNSTTLVAIDTPNDNNIDPNWQKYICTVRDIEKNTGYNLLSNLPKTVQDAIEVTHYNGTPKARKSINY